MSSCQPCNFCAMFSTIYKHACLLRSINLKRLILKRITSPLNCKSFRQMPNSSTGATAQNPWSIFHNLMNTIARIIDDAPHSAAFNMAADLHVLSLCDKTPAVTVRLYSWEKPSITLGISEKPHETLDLRSLEQ